MFKLAIIGLALAAVAGTTHAACVDQNIKLQVLGSGGPVLFANDLDIIDIE